MLYVSMVIMQNPFLLFLFFFSLDVLATGNNGCGTTSTNLVPLESGDCLPSEDAVQDTNDPEVNGNEETEQVAHAHQQESDGEVDETLDKAVVEESELGGDQRHVKLTKNHHNTEGNCDCGKDEEREAEVLVAEDTVSVEGSADVHVDPALVRRAAIAVDAIVMAHAVVVGGDGEVVESDHLRASGGRLGPEAGLERLIG